MEACKAFVESVYVEWNELAGTKVRCGNYAMGLTFNF
jgi:hypothetical protein